MVTMILVTETDLCLTTSDAVDATGSDLTDRMCLSMTLVDAPPMNASMHLRQATRQVLCDPMSDLTLIGVNSGIREYVRPSDWMSRSHGQRLHAA